MNRLFSDASEWVLASHNAGKIKELSAMLQHYQIRVQGASDLGLEDPEETEKTFSGNAFLKARAASKASGRVALADDSGLCVTALDDAPGIYSARWAGEPRDFHMAMKRVHDTLVEKDAKDWSARFVCVLALVHPGGDEISFTGEVHGKISWPPLGDDGFGYDPIFIPEGHERTFAQMTAEEKKSMSHRARVIEKLIQDVFQP